MYAPHKSDLLHYLVPSGGGSPFFFFFFFVLSLLKAEPQQSFTTRRWTNGSEALQHGRLTSVSAATTALMLYCHTATHLSTEADSGRSSQLSGDGGGGFNRMRVGAKSIKRREMCKSCERAWYSIKMGIREITL